MRCVSRYPCGYHPRMQFPDDVTKDVTNRLRRAEGAEIDKAKELIEKIATKAPFAISQVIECVNAYYEEGVDGFWKEVDAFGECSGTEDFREGAAAFVEKRKAVFSGR